MVKPAFCLVGASWSIKGFTPENYNIYEDEPRSNDVRFTDSWGLSFVSLCRGGKSNLELLDLLKENLTDPALPIIWIWVEPGRDYGRITGKGSAEWMSKENAFEIRQELAGQILQEVRKSLPNPIALIGADDIENTDLAKELDITVIHRSWQHWIANRINYPGFNLGWCAPDVQWKLHDKEIKKPSKKIVFETYAWLQFNKEAELKGYMYMYHPTPLAHEEFGKFIKPSVLEWLDSIKK